MSVGSSQALAMRAPVIGAAGELRMHDAPVPEPGAGQLRIRMEGCGVCGSNLPVWEGRPWFEYPLEPGAPGHEGWGVVDAVGEGVHALRPGDRVAALSYRAFAPFDVAEADACVRLPTSLDGVPFPGEALGCAMNVFARSDIRPGATVAIVGIGFMGALLVQLAAAAGARVIAIGRRPFALDIARSGGAAEVVPMDDHWRIIERVRELTGGRFCDVVIEAVGAQWPLDLAAELTRERGRLVIAAYQQDGLRQVNMQLWNWRGIDVINAHERETAVYVAGMRAAVDAVAEGRIQLASLITHTFPLDRLDAAFEAMRSRPDGFLKAVVVP